MNDPDVVKLLLHIKEMISRVISMGYTGNGERDVRRMQSHLEVLWVDITKEQDKLSK